MFRLKRLMLKGFKSIREMEIELGSLSVLVGPNGAGKSNLLSFFRMMEAIRQQKLQPFVGAQGGANAILHHGRKRTPDLGAKLVYDADPSGEAAYSIVLTGAPLDDLVFLSEELAHAPADGGPARKVLIPGGRRESSLPEERERTRKKMQPMPWGAATWRFAYHHFLDTSLDASIKQEGAVSDDRLLRQDGGNLAAFLYSMKVSSPEHYMHIRDTVRAAAPFFDDFVLMPDVFNPAMIRLEWRERGTDMPLSAHHLSDGTLRFIALATVLLQPEMPDDPCTLLIDDPELGLHPYTLGLLADMMREASRRTQLIVATQSISLLHALAEAEEVIVVERSGGQSFFRRLEGSKFGSWRDVHAFGALAL